MSLKPTYEELEQRIKLLEEAAAEPKGVKDAFHESEESFRELVELLPEAVFEMDLKGNLTFGNKKARNTFGYAPEDLAAGLNVFDMVASDDLERALKNTQRLMHGEIGPNEYKLRRKDGSFFLSIIHSTPIIRDGRPVGFRGFFLDITETKRLEEEREKLILELQEALKKVKLLSGLLPVCASCKKIRNDKGYWEQIEVYIREHSEAEFSHSICPECAERLYPGSFKKK